MTKTTINILLIEDNPGGARLLQEILAEEEIEKGILNVERVNWLSAAFERLDSGSIDLILTDLSLPNSFGIHTLTRICTRAPQVPVIVLSGLDDVTMIEKAKKAGAYDYLLKENLDHESLMQAIHQAIKHKKSV